MFLATIIGGTIFSLAPLLSPEARAGCSGIRVSPCCPRIALDIISILSRIAPVMYRNLDRFYPYIRTQKA